MVNKGYIKTYDFRKFKTIRVFVNEIRNNIINLYTANDERNNLANYIKEFKTKTKPQNNSYFKKVKKDVINSAVVVHKRREMVLKTFETGISSKLKESEKSEQSSDDVKYNSFGYDTYKLSKKLKDVSLKNISQVI